MKACIRSMGLVTAVLVSCANAQEHSGLTLKAQRTHDGVRLSWSEPPHGSLFGVMKIRRPNGNSGDPRVRLADRKWLDRHATAPGTHSYQLVIFRLPGGHGQQGQVFAESNLETIVIEGREGGGGTEHQPPREWLAHPKDLKARVLPRGGIEITWTDETPDETRWKVQIRRPGGTDTEDIPADNRQPGLRRWPDEKATQPGTYTYTLWAERDAGTRSQHGWSRVVQSHSQTTTVERAPDAAPHPEPAAREGSEDEARRIGAEATMLAKTGRFGEASSMLRGLLAGLPQHDRRSRAIAWFNLGWVKSREAEAGGSGAARDEAIVAYREVLKATPGSAQAVQNLVLALDAAGQREDATRLLESELERELNPTLGIMLMDRHVVAGATEASWKLGLLLAEKHWNDARVHDRLATIGPGVGIEAFLGYLERARAKGPAALAQKGAAALLQDPSKIGVDASIRALVIWVDALVAQGAIGPPDLATIRPKVLPDAAIVHGLRDLDRLVAAPRNELGPRSFGWWLETFERRHAASGVLRVRGDAAVRAGAFEDAEAFYLLAKSAAPKAQDHARSGRDQERMAGLEASAALARLYHRGRQSVDPDGRKLDALTNAIFDDKMEAYAQQNVPGMRQFHETLSVIYYDSKRWDKADFQLARTVETEKTLARMKGRDPAPLPHIERMRTDTLVHLGRYDDAAKSAVTASRGFFALKQPEQVPDTLRLVAPKLDQLSEPRRAEYRLWQQVSEGTRGFFEQDSERQVRTVREIESKLTPTGAGNVTIDRKVLGEALDGLLERAGDRARAAGKTTEQKQLSQERTRLRAEFPDLRKP